MNDSKLKLNTGKTEFLIIGTQRQRDKIECLSPSPILDQNLTPTTSARNLGITFEKKLNFRQHIFKLCRCCFYHIRDLRRIRRYLPLSVSKTIATSLVSSRHDYCHSLYHNITLKDIMKLQRVQNCLSKGSFDHLLRIYFLSPELRQTLELELSRLQHLLGGTHYLSVLRHVKIYQHFGVI